MAASTAYAMGVYRSHEKRTDEIRARVPKTLKLGVARLAAVWTHVDRLLTGDEELEVSEADAVNRLLEIALPLAWAEIGKEPKTDADVAEVKRLAEKVLADIRPEGAKKK